MDLLFIGEFKTKEWNYGTIAQKGKASGQMISFLGHSELSTKGKFWGGAVWFLIYLYSCQWLF